MIAQQQYTAVQCVMMHYDAHSAVQQHSTDCTVHYSLVQDSAVQYGAGTRQCSAIKHSTTMVQYGTTVHVQT